jgi:hypothetical protein
MATLGDQTGNLVRGFRLQDAWVKLGGIALALDLNPSAHSPGPNVDAQELAVLATPDSPAHTHESDVRDIAGHAATVDSATLLPEPNQDALLHGLEAAHDAIKQSLAPTPADEVGATPFAQADGNGSSDVPDTKAAGDIVDLPAFHDASSTEATTVAPNSHMGSADDAQPPAIGQLGSGLDSAESSLSDVFHGLAQGQTELLTPANVFNVASSVLNVASSTVSVLDEGLASLSSAVTVPSMHGVGLDALAGLVTPPAAMPAPAPQIPITDLHLGLDDISAIGLHEVTHPDAAVHQMVHAALPAAGSGLI